jgi:hypothetical protein
MRITPKRYKYEIVSESTNQTVTPMSNKKEKRVITEQNTQCGPSPLVITTDFAVTMATG